MTTPDPQPTSSVEPRLVTLSASRPRVQRRRRADARPHRERIVRLEPAGRPRPPDGTDEFDTTNPPDDGNANIHVSFHDGALITNVSLQLLFWGNAWTQPSATPAPREVIRAVQNLLAGPYMSGLDQYGIGPGTLRGASIVLEDPPNPIAKDDWHNLIWDLIDQDTFPEPDDPGGRNFYLFILPAGVGYNVPNVTGVHGYPGDYDFPFDYEVAWAGFVLNDGTLDSITERLSHELVEACTDPEDDGWTIDGRSPPEDEICDVCQNTTGRVNGVLVQGYWSQRDRACLIPTASWSSWFQIHPETVFDHTTQQIFALSRNSFHIDLFVIGFDNAIWSTWWEASAGWQPWFRIHPETVFDHTKQRVFALSRNPDHVDLFVIGFDNVVWSTWWEAGPGWQPWFQIHPERVFDHTKQRVFALSRNPDHVDLFVIGFDNAVWSTWWEASPGWQPWFQIHPATVFDHTAQHVCALSRNPGHIDLFVIGFDNPVWSTWWEAGPGWQPWFQIHPETVFDHTRQRVFALSRNPGHIDLFVIGFDNVVWSTWWEAGPGWQPWFQIHPETVFDHTSQQIVALSRNPDHVDLFVIGFDNAVWSTWWEAGPGWQPWFQIHPETVFDHTSQEIFALSRNPGHIDLFVVGFDNAVWSARWG